MQPGGPRRSADTPAWNSDGDQLSGVFQFLDGDTSRSGFQPKIVGEIFHRSNAVRLRRSGDQLSMRICAADLAGEQLGGEHLLGQGVDPLEPAASRADYLTPAKQYF